MAPSTGSFAVLFAVVVFLGSGPSAEAKCPLVMGKAPFEADKFAGHWFLVAGSSDSRRLKGCGRGHYNITVVPHRKGHDAVFGFTFSSSTRAGSPERQFEGVGQSILGEGTAMMYSVQRRAGEPEYGGVFRQAVIATDYTTFAVTLSCRPEYDIGSETFGRTLFADILSRTPNMSQERIRTLANVLASYGIDEQDILPTC